MSIKQELESTVCINYLDVQVFQYYINFQLEAASEFGKTSRKITFKSAKFIRYLKLYFPALLPWKHQAKQKNQKIDLSIFLAERNLILKKIFLKEYIERFKQKCFGFPWAFFNKHWQYAKIDTMEICLKCIFWQVSLLVSMSFVTGDCLNLCLSGFLGVF